jgi:creatinine amidohydrolase
MRWDELTSTRLAAAVAADPALVALVPVGATEQHGPHLGVGVDSVIAERLCEAVASATRVPMLPTLPYGCSLGHSRR